MFKLDRDTGAITLPRGDTMTINVTLRDKELPAGTMAVFGVRTTGNRSRNLLTRAFPVENNQCVIRLSNKDSRELSVGVHCWDLRIVVNPERNEDGSIRCDDESDEVYSVFSGGSAMPGFTVTEVAADI